MRPYSRQLRIETLERRDLLSVTGDAPAPYPAASVSSQTGPRLGESYADNGIQFATVRVGAIGAMVRVDIEQTGARLDAWIDFNNDKTFSREDEQIFDAVDLVIGTHWLMFDVPSWAEEGVAQSRFRVSSFPNPASGLAQEGVASNGEIEDHLVEIVPPISGTGNFGAANIVNSSTNTNGAVDVLTGDFNSDGLMDIVSSSYVDGQINLWKQTAGGSWTRTLVGTVDTSVDFSAIGLVADDLDGDGDLDIASASASDDTVAWYRNNNNATSFSKFTIVTGALGARAIVAADFDRDGRIDLASAALEDGFIRVHENTGSGALFSSAATAVVNSDPGGQLDPGLADIFAADINNDGRIDIVSAAATFNRLAWYQNNASPFSGAWVDQSILPDSAATGEPRASGVFVADMDGDGDFDVVATNFDDDKLVWFRNRMGEGGAPWSSENLIAGSRDGANPAYVADLDGDGDMDVVVPKYFDDQIDWYRNDGSGAFVLGDTLALSTSTNIAVADISGDGILDIVAGSDLGDRVVWFENPAAPRTNLPGDYNDDLKVDQIDYIEWKKAFGTANSSVDGNNDGIVNAADYTIWRDNLGAVATASAALVAADSSGASYALLVGTPREDASGVDGGTRATIGSNNDMAFREVGEALLERVLDELPAPNIELLASGAVLRDAAMQEWQADPLAIRWNDLQ